MNEIEKDSIAFAILALAAFVFVGSVVLFAPVEIILAVVGVIAIVAVTWAIVQLTSR